MAHIHEKIDFTVSVFVVYQNTVLLRMHEKYHKWLGVGGHIELDEDANTAAVREVKEEVGLDVTLVPPAGWVARTEKSEVTLIELIPPIHLNIHKINETHQHHDFIFAARSESNTVVPEHPDDTWKWYTRDELLADKEVDGSVRHYALASLTLAGSSS